LREFIFSFHKFLANVYDKIEQAESELIDARAKKKAIEEDKVRADNIYRILSQFEKLYAVLTDKERQEVLQALIAEIHIHETPQPNGQWLKSIKFRLPIIDGKDELSLDNQDGVETVVLLSKGEISTKSVRVEFPLEGLDNAFQANDLLPAIK
jgi:site-specific DNA recombinase